MFPAMHRAALLTVLGILFRDNVVVRGALSVSVDPPGGPSSAGDVSSANPSTSLGDVSSVSPTSAAPSSPTSSPGDVSSSSPATPTDSGSASLTDSATSQPTDSGSASAPASPTSFQPSSTVPPPTSSSSSLPPVTNPPSNHAGAIAGGVIGALAFIGLVGFGLMFFLRRRNLHRRGARDYPPSPRLKSPWGRSGPGGGIPGAGSIRSQNRPQRLGSQGSIPTAAGMNPSVASRNSAGEYGPTSEQDHYTAAVAANAARSDDAHEYPSDAFDNYPVLVSSTSPGGGRHRSTGSRTSFPATATSRTSYDLSVFREGDSRGSFVPPTSPPSPSVGPYTSSRYSNSDPFASTSNVAATADVERRSSGNKVARKPPPKYTGGDSSSSSSKPPTTGPTIGAIRSRSSSTGSNSSGVVIPNLNHKGSSGTFKFAGEKEGPVHYLIPDMPMQQPGQ